MRHRDQGNEVQSWTLVVLLPLTMAAAVGLTGFFTLTMTARFHLVHGLFGPGLARSLSELQAQILAVSLATGCLGIGVALKAASRRGRRNERSSHASRAEAAPGESSLAGAFNETIGLLNRHSFEAPGERPQESNSLDDRLRHADRLATLGTLTAGVAHEIRNPLASLQGMAELLGRDFQGDDPRAAYVATMLKAVERLNALVERILLLSSPGGSEPEVFDLGQTVRETMLMARLGLGDRQVSLESDDAGEPLAVSGSAARLSQALTNIVLNAVQATPEGGAITVTTARAGEEAIVSVHNTGSYIPPGVIERISLPFYTTKPRGTGLGLAIASQVVASHGGRIDVESEREKGTRFTIRLPLSDGCSSREA